MTNLVFAVNFLSSQPMIQAVYRDVARMVWTTSSGGA